MIARVCCVLLVAGLVLGMGFGGGLDHELGRDAPPHAVSELSQAAAPDSAEPSRMCTTGHAWALTAGSSLTPPPVRSGRMQPVHALRAVPKCDNAPPVQPPRTLA